MKKAFVISLFILLFLSSCSLFEKSEWKEESESVLSRTIYCLEFDKELKDASINGESVSGDISVKVFSEEILIEIETEKIKTGLSDLAFIAKPVLELKSKDESVSLSCTLTLPNSERALISIRRSSEDYSKFIDFVKSVDKRRDQTIEINVSTDFSISLGAFSTAYQDNMEMKNISFSASGFSKLYSTMTKSGHIS